MRYALLVYTNEALLPGLMTDDAVAAFVQLGREVAERGRQQLTVGLGPTSLATTVRVRAGQVLITDGPFAETHEQLGGLSITAFATAEEALAHAARVPTAVAGSVEVRPVVERAHVRDSRGRDVPRP